ncbi:MAG: chemotaxis protein CheW, partial [Minwuiales bacterium]|nr:chemotaxis protein CheW [Minwuiales bacterium]
VDLLENLMTMISELVLTRNQLLQMVRGMEDSEFTVPLQRLSSITTELQEGVMKTRMQPIGNAWAKLPRIVRDLALELDKKIDLQMYGQDTELDRQVLELIKDPLTHMVRNSADHGMETPDLRTAAGKKETGRITLNAFHEGGHIIIEISDDGHGINIEKVKQKALDNGLTTEAELEGMSDQQIQQFIFRAGFSTAEKVTNVSGRGVGMDVVRTNIEKIGGTIDLRSEEGNGSCFTIKIPLTLAIVSALIVECAQERFAVPQLSVVELVRASTKDSDHKIETINDTPVLRLRDRLLPLVHLDRVIGLSDVMPVEETPAEQAEDAEAGAEGEADEAAAEAAKPDVIKAEAFIIVTQVGNYQFGIVVDRVFDTEEIVVKPIAPILRDLSIYSGNTILGDGSVIMILDPNGVAATTGEVSVSDAEAEQLAQSMASSDDQTSLLMFRAGNEEPKAVPLSLVARLEEIEVDSIEHANGQYVAQYRGKLMPLIKMSQDCKMRETGRQPVLVFADDDRSMGLVVDEILDIVDENLKVELQAGRDGLLGTAVVAGQATEVIDVAHFLHSAFSDWFSKTEGVGTGGGKRRAKVLLVDDSPFFRNMLVPMLQVAGYEVTTADDPVHALKLRDSGTAFDVIVSDIEMPGMNGYEFAQECKKDGRWQDIPIVALSSHTAPQDLEKGRAVGFTDYIAKSDRDGLLNTLSQTIGFVGDAA